jgi:glycogen phosphorylase
LSIGDGWWAEGYNGRNGWLIEGHAAASDEAATDQADADALYRLLETEIVPAFYDRDERLVPHRWVRIVKEAIRSVTPTFSTRRMVKDYVVRMYTPAMQQPAGRR